MLAQTLTLDDRAGVDVVYQLVSQNGTETRRIDAATNLAYPRQLSIKHTVQGSALDAVDRHLIQFTDTVSGAKGPVTATVNLTIAMPRDPAMTQQKVETLLANLVDFLSDGSIATPLPTVVNVTAILRGES
jgi:hypothetical protein